MYSMPVFNNALPMPGRHNGYMDLNNDSVYLRPCSAPKCRVAGLGNDYFPSHSFPMTSYDAQTPSSLAASHVSRPSTSSFQACSCPLLSQQSHHIYLPFLHRPHTFLPSSPPSSRLHKNFSLTHKPSPSKTHHVVRPSSRQRAQAKPRRSKFIHHHISIYGIN